MVQDTTSAKKKVNVFWIISNVQHRQCVCPECFYGSRCQFSTNGSILSLDSIFGYQIHRDIGIHQQPVAVKIMIAIVTLIFVLGVIDGSLALLTFESKNTHDFRYSLYLFVSSITSLITMTVFAMKSFFFLTSHMSLLHNWLAIYVIPMCVIITSLTHIHDPMHRNLVDDDEEQQSWCITSYLSPLKIFDWFVDILHFLTPFLSGLFRHW